MVSKDKLEEWFYLEIFLIAMLFAFIAVIELYISIDRLMGIWLDYRYKPLFQAFFSLSILAISLYLIRERLIR